MDNLQPHYFNPFRINQCRILASRCKKPSITIGLWHSPEPPPLARKIGLSLAPLGKPYARPARDRQGSYLSVKVAFPDTARPSLAELLRRACSLGKPVIGLAARGRLRSGGFRVRSILRYSSHSLRSFREAVRFAAASPVHPPPHF